VAGGKSDHDCKRARRYAVRQYEFLSNLAQSVGGTPKTKKPSARASERRSLHRSSLAASLAKLLHLVELRPRFQASQLALNCALALLQGGRADPAKITIRVMAITSLETRLP
jgi:hypothetical protein